MYCFSILIHIVSHLLFILCSFSYVFLFYCFQLSVHFYMFVEYLLVLIGLIFFPVTFLLKTFFESQLANLIRLTQFLFIVDAFVVCFLFVCHYECNLSNRTKRNVFFFVQYRSIWQYFLGHCIMFLICARNNTKKIL